MTTITVRMTDADATLFDLMSWMSPAWPIGAFAHSGGLEWAVEQGFLTQRAQTRDWLDVLLGHGPLHNDTVTFVHAWRAAAAGDIDRLHEVAELAAAAQTGFERRLESTAQGAAFRRIALDALDQGGGLREKYASLLASIPDADLTYPVAAAALFAAHGINLPQALTAYLHGAMANLVSAAQRLVPLGQTDAQRIMRDLRPAILAAVDAACDLPGGDPFDAFAGAAPMAELGCMAHEIQYTRLFRT